MKKWLSSIFLLLRQFPRIRHLNYDKEVAMMTYIVFVVEGLTMQVVGT